MKISDIKNEQALDTLADILEPLADILQDEAVKDAFANDSRLKAVSVVIKKHKKSVIEIMARLDGCEPDKYEFNLMTLPAKILEILNDPGFTDLFTSPETATE